MNGRAVLMVGILGVILAAKASTPKPTNATAPQAFTPPDQIAGGPFGRKSLGDLSWMQWAAVPQVIGASGCG